MPITPPQGMREAVEARMSERLDDMRNAIIYRLASIGEQAVNEARTGHGYTNRTGNLTSSIGYVIALDGEVVQASDFRAVDGGAEGSAEGERYARSLVSKFPKGAALIVTAGMSYAGYVSAKGLNVIDSAELLAEREVPRILARLGFKV